MRWVCVFRGTGLVDAWLARDWLEASGVPVQVRGDLKRDAGANPNRRGLADAVGAGTARTPRSRRWA